MVTKPDNSENTGSEVVFEFKRYVWINAEAKRRRNQHKYEIERNQMYRLMEERASKQPQQANLIAPGEIMLFLGEEKEAQSSTTTEKQKDDTKKEKKGKRAHEERCGTTEAKLQTNDQDFFLVQTSYVEPKRIHKGE